MVLRMPMLPTHADDPYGAGDAVMAVLTGGPAAGNSVLDEAMLRLRQQS